MRGSPQRMDDDYVPVKVYPRECGAADEIAANNANDAGLSPRVRGSRF